MVGKGADTNIKSSRIFHQCYVKCCKLQNLTPITNVIPSGNGKVLDFCVDRIKYVDWAPILNALSCDLSLHTVSIKCRQQVKTILEHIDCERLAKTVNKRAVILTKFMLGNLVEAIAQLLANTTLLTTLTLEGLPLRIPYLHPLCEAVLTNNCLQHLYLPRCLVGDAGCLALCKAIRSLPNILTLDLSGCELTLLGASYIADLIKHQKIHRYSENWVHTLRYRLPELDTMAGLRRISLCGNLQLGDAGLAKLLEVLADDLWIKALDAQGCGLSEATANTAMQMMQSNTTIVVLDLRNNVEISNESLSKLRGALRENERNGVGQFSWLSSVTSISCGDRTVKAVVNKTGKERVASMTRSATNKYPAKPVVTKKEKDYAETLEEQLQEEISHRQQLEELNLQLVDQMRQLKQQQLRLWANNNSSGSEQSFQASSGSGDLSSNTDSSRSVPIDQNTLSYIQQAFRDIYSYIKNNQCAGNCQHQNYEPTKDLPTVDRISEETEESGSAEDLKINIAPKKAQSTHAKLAEPIKVNKTTKSAHILENANGNGDVMKHEMIEKQIGDTKELNANNRSILEEMMAQIKAKNLCTSASPVSACSVGSAGSAGSAGSGVSDSSATLVCSPAVNPRDALYSSDDEDS